MSAVLFGSCGMKRVSAAAVVATLFVAGSSFAATATYSDGVFTTNSVLGLVGTSAEQVFGLSFTDTSLTTANGYTFTPFSSNPTRVTYDSGLSVPAFNVTTTGDANFNTILTAANVVGGSNLTLNNLTSGQVYNVLFMYADDRSGIDGPRLASVNDGTNSHSTTVSWVNAGGAPNVGSYNLATFTASGTTQSFTLGGPGGPQLNALLIGAPGTPEPALLGLASLTGAALLRRRARKA